MLCTLDDDILIEIYRKAVNSDVEDDEIFDNFISILEAEMEKRGLLKDIS